ncbi:MULTISPECIES: AAA family ATPase [unclassified Gordonia (in: high G+C Gram-positive bacteria)]|uniref:AAA family ATPase n=1 Tax=unclassified Gordonia (in: high G+C Gram-positive bacteria) TaxID=2657482 RepID=UPI0007EB2091|nr:MULTISPECIES: AAA family ATPase [unclassified Gordonia (in: high G+C Gram-positive bacteria)]OBB99622.1 ATPase [Gordonia sp. 852002-50395_SCH5434458]OBC13905.1 ATPase [Gordonia sp. 852002-50816_SCH5313054-c]OBC16213.1 ATPase [Gordonia sp. 852002-50816_SCH5313054-a]
MNAQLTLTARLNTSAADSRRGIVRAHPEALTALGLREWDAVSITGARVTAAVVAAAPSGTPTGTLLLDDITFSNAGIKENASVVLSEVAVHGAARVVVTGSAVASRGVDEATLRRALLGKVLSVGDAVSLLPRDLGPELSASAATRALTLSVGITWTNELLTVTATDPGSPVSVQPSTAVLWASDGVDAARGGVGAAPRAADTSPGVVGESRGAVGAAAGGVGRGWLTTPPGAESPGHVVRPASELVGVDAQVAKLTEWLSITLDEPGVLRALGATPRLGVLLSGPAGSGKATLVRSVCAARTLTTIDGPTIGSLEASARLRAVSDAIADLRRSGSGVLLITDVDALLPAKSEPVSTLILDELRAAISPTDATSTSDDHIALIVTSAEPAGLDERLRAPDLCDRELVIGLPDAARRARILGVILTGVPTDGALDLDHIAARTPGFVAGDLAALAREAALRAAARASASDAAPSLTDDDLIGALDVIRPVSRLRTPEVAVGSITLDDVGDMTETKQALTETVLWPLQHPDTFTRLGVEPPRGVLLYGPPGCGKTFVVRALAASGMLSVHMVKGAELMDKWVGSSEKAVRDLFAAARESAPSLIFLDEVDALAPRRGQSTDAGVGDRVVAALLTELDGVEPLQDVVVLGATNRPDLIDPALLRPGRLERLVFVPPPDAQARAEILRTSGRKVPLADGIDLDALAADLEGYSAADCAALLREAALAAMRRDIDAATVTADDVVDARTRVRPSLDAAQVEDLRAYADRRSE